MYKNKYNILIEGEMKCFFSLFSPKNNQSLTDLPRSFIEICRSVDNHILSIVQYVFEKYTCCKKKTVYSKGREYMPNNFLQQGLVNFQRTVFMALFLSFTSF